MMFIYVIVVYVSSDPGTYIVRIRFAFWNRVWQSPTLQTDESLGRFAIAPPGFRKLMFHYDRVPIMLLFYLCSWQDH